MNSELLREFDDKYALFERLRTEALFTLEAALAASPIKLHSVTSRLKTRDSFLRKASLKTTGKPFEEIRDIVGIRVVCLFLPDVERVGEIVRESFNVLAEDNKIAGADVTSFGYMSVHFDVVISDANVGPRYDAIHAMPLEIQVRTIAMDAWANVAHHLSYKSDIDVPDILKRDFHALSGLFYVADKHFELFYGASNAAREATLQAFNTDRADTVIEAPLNVDTLEAYLQTTFPDRDHNKSNQISDLLAELTDGGVADIREIDRVIQATKTAFAKYEREHPPSGRRFSDVGVVRVSFHLYDKKFNRLTYFSAEPSATQKQFENWDDRYKPFRKLVKRPRRRAG